MNSLSTAAPATKPSWRVSWIIFVIGLLAALLPFKLTPHEEALTLGDLKLAQSLPGAFGEWSVDRSIAPVVIDPSVLAAVAEIYSDTLARTYRNARGDRVMLSLAYGRRQDDTMRLHRPEGCYAGQGFGVRKLPKSSLTLDGSPIAVASMHASLGLREESVVYWMSIGGKLATTQTEAKFAQLSFALKGQLADGLLIRISSINVDDSHALALHQSFAAAMVEASAPALKRALLGK